MAERVIVRVLLRHTEQIGNIYKDMYLFAYCIYRNHIKSFIRQKYSIDTEVSKYIWRLIK
jgi:hypothetical protein